MSDVNVINVNNYVLFHFPYTHTHVCLPLVSALTQLPDPERLRESRDQRTWTHLRHEELRRVHIPRWPRQRPRHQRYSNTDIITALLLSVVGGRSYMYVHHYILQSPPISTWYLVMAFKFGENGASVHYSHMVFLAMTVFCGVLVMIPAV